LRSPATNRFFAGWRSDPFFFDVPGSDQWPAVHRRRLFSPIKTCAASCWKWPNSTLAPKRLGLWARTLVGAGGKWVQVDRGALPAQAVFLVGTERDAYLAGEPVDDARFVAGFAHALEHAGGYAPDEARRVAATLLPEMMSYDPTRPRPFRPMDGHSPTTRAMLFWRSSQTGR